MSFIDISYSCSKPELARVKDTRLELSVNFNRKILKGKAILTIVKEPFVTEIILDNYKLNIGNVRDLDTKKHLKYHLGDNTNFGSPFTIQLRTVGDIDRYAYKIQIEYETNPESPALYWLNPEQTADGKHPFMLSNNKMTYAKSVFPCQDTPSVKSTYSAKITVAGQFTVLMSAPFVSFDDNRQKYTVSFYFHQTKPIPSYAVVIVVGTLQRATIGSRSCVFAEDKFFQKSIKTFADIDRMLMTAENLCGPYVFEMFNICVLPPSISHFKIQCPHVTFVSPTLIGGDISMSCTIAMNIASNWAGNLVTCKSYNHLWMHESFSKFIYIKIINRILMQEELVQFVAKLESIPMQTQMIMKMKNTSLIKSLIPNLEDMSPNDFTQYVPYEIGFILLCELEELLGGPSVFEQFLKSYFSKFAFQSITTNDWLKFLYESFPHKTRLLSSIDWDTRFFSTSFIEKYDCKDIATSAMLETKYCNMAREWVRWDDNFEYIPLTFLDVKTSFDLLKLYFLQNLYPLNMTTTKLKTMSVLYDFQSDIHSYAIRNAWLRLCIKNRWKEKIPAALDFAIDCCIPDYVCSIYQDLFEMPETHSLLKESYRTIRTKLLRETQRKLESILHL